MNAGHYAEKDLEQRARLLTALYVAQEQYGYLSPEAVERVAERLRMSPGEVYSAATFYSMYRTHPVGRYVIQVCEGLSCHLAGGAEALATYLQGRLGIRLGETTADKRFTLVTVPCLAACDASPAMRVNDTLYERLTNERIDALLTELRGG
ncbi:MAG: NADH-quinone oxidoreductase subunit NuoE [Chloroflexota bacterium]